MDRLNHKGYIIKSCTHQLSDDGRWAIDIDIEHEDIVTNFSAGDTFETKEEAATHCLNFGQQIIDGNVPGCVAP